MNEIKDNPDMPGFKAMQESDDAATLLNHIVYDVDGKRTRLGELNNKDVLINLEKKLSEERESGRTDIQDRLLTLMAKIQEFGRIHYPQEVPRERPPGTVIDTVGPLKVLNERIAGQQRKLDEALQSRDLHGAYNHTAVKQDEKEIARLRKDIKQTKDEIFAHHHRMKLNTGRDNEKLKDRGTAGRLLYAIRRRGAGNYLKKGEISPLRDEINRLLSVGNPAIRRESTTMEDKAGIATHAPLVQSMNTLDAMQRSSSLVSPNAVQRLSKPEVVEAKRNAPKALDDHNEIDRGSPLKVRGGSYDANGPHLNQRPATPEDFSSPEELNQSGEFDPLEDPIYIKALLNFAGNST